MNKILRYSLIMLLAFIGTVSYAQTTVTFVAGTDKGSNGTADNADEVSKEGITIQSTAGAFNATQFRFAKSSTTTISSTVGKITKVVFTCTVSGTTKYGPGCFTSATSGDYSFSEKIGTWTGNADSFSLTAGTNQVRATKIEVTYSASGETTSKTDAGLQWSQTYISLKKGNELTAPTFTKATTAEVTFTSDNEDVATVNSEGVISLGTEAGTAKITATSAENDTYAAGTATCTIEVYNVNVYKKATTLESGKKYLIVAQRDGKTYYAIPHSADKEYGYLSTSYATGTLDKLEINQKYDDSFVFAAEGNGYSIKDSQTGRYYIQQGTYKSFNLSETATAWTVEPQADGTFKIEQNGYYMQFGQGTFESFGVYTEAQDNTVMPMLYVYDEGTSTGIGSVNAATSNANAPIYNLAGQRVGNDYKGVVIQNGKKRINK